MGKRDKKQRHPERHSRRGVTNFAQEEGEVDDGGAFERYLLNPPTDKESEEEEEEEEKEEEKDDRNDKYPSKDIPSKFHLYQQSVQSPKGDISYLQKFFLMYVGGRVPLHFQEDFCGTALLSTEWLRSDSRRTAIGLDLDLEALNWCMENNVNKVGADMSSGISLFHGNVLQPDEAKLVLFEPSKLICKISLENTKVDSDNRGTSPESSVLEQSGSSGGDSFIKRNYPLAARDIVCAFNYSCCCLHSRADLVLYFKHALASLSKKGGIFVMDLYGGTSSERKLKLQRKFSNFTYVWEQAEFDVVGRKTRISLHFHLQNQQKKLRHAFSYSWRLWSLPEIKDCLEEAGFKSVHFWLRQMPDTEDIRSIEGFGSGKDVKYEEINSFQQQDSWNAYIVGVA